MRVMSLHGACFEDVCKDSCDDMYVIPSRLAAFDIIVDLSGNMSVELYAVQSNIML